MAAGCSVPIIHTPPFWMNRAVLPRDLEFRIHDAAGGHPGQGTPGCAAAAALSAGAASRCRTPAPPAADRGCAAAGTSRYWQYTHFSAGLRPTPASIRSSSCPASPTNGSPWASSFAPGLRPPAGSPRPAARYQRPPAAAWWPAGSLCRQGSAAPVSPIRWLVSASYGTLLRFFFQHTTFPLELPSFLHYNGEEIGGDLLRP